MGRPKLDISDEERYERHKERCKNYKKKRMELDPEYKKKVQEYNINYLRAIVRKGNEAKELRIKQEQEEKTFKAFDALNIKD
jgi:radical SAM superfamily enzyme with C-terminal helix-hairpin-helix motif